jgi:hypothetical protein
MADPLSSECGPVRNPLQSKGDQPQPHTSNRQSYRAILDSNELKYSIAYIASIYGKTYGVERVSMDQITSTPKQLGIVLQRYRKV